MVLIFWLCAPTLMTESSTLDPLIFFCFALVFAIKQSDAALSHIILVSPLLVLTFCTCIRQVSMFVLWHTLADVFLPSRV